MKLKNNKTNQVLKVYQVNLCLAAKLLHYLCRLTDMVQRWNGLTWYKIQFLATCHRHGVLKGRKDCRLPSEKWQQFVQITWMSTRYTIRYVLTLSALSMLIALWKFVLSTSVIRRYSFLIRRLGAWRLWRRRSLGVIKLWAHV